MQKFRLYAVILGHLAFAIAVYATWALGQHYAPEMMNSQAMLAPFVLSVVGIWIWFGFWSRDVLRKAREVKK